MDELFQALFGGSSMEARYLNIIAFLDKAETLANTGVKEEVVDPKLALMIAEAKQQAISDFAATNERTTLASVRERAQVS